MMNLFIPMMHLCHIPKYTTLEQKCAHFCSNVLFCGICEIGLLEQCQADATSLFMVLIQNRPIMTIWHVYNKYCDMFTIVIWLISPVNALGYTWSHLHINISVCFNHKWCSTGLPTHMEFPYFVRILCENTTVRISPKNMEIDLCQFCHLKCHQSSNIRCTLVGNKLVDHSDVVGAALNWTPGFNGLGKDNCKTRREILSLGVWYTLWIRVLTVLLEQSLPLLESKSDKICGISCIKNMCYMLMIPTRAIASYHNECFEYDIEHMKG